MDLIRNALEDLKSADLDTQKRGIGFFKFALKEDLPIPAKLLQKIVQVAVHSQENIEFVIDVLEKHLIFDDDGNMLYVILIDYSINCIRNSDKKSGWKLLKMLILLKREEIKQIFPGVFKECFETIKSNILSSVGSSRMVLADSCESFEVLLSFLDENNCDEWTVMARERTKSLLDNLCKVILGATNIDPIRKLIKILITELKNTVNEYRLDLFILLVTQGSTETSLIDSFDTQELTKILIKEIGRKSIIQEKNNLIKGILLVVDKIQDLPLFLSLNMNFIMKIIYELVETIEFLDQSSYKSNCDSLFRVIIRFEILDILIEAYYELLKELEENQRADSKQISQTSYLLSLSNVEMSLNLLEKYLSCNKNARLQQLYLQLIYQCKDSLSDLEIFQAVITGYSPETEDFIRTNIIDGRELKSSSLSNHLKNRIKFLDFSNLKHSFAFVLDFIDPDHILVILEDMLEEYDQKYRCYSYKDTLDFIDFCQLACSKVETLEFANTLRSILLRFKPLLSLSPSLLNNRKLMLKTLLFFKFSIPMLDSVPIEIDRLSKHAFSIEEEANVSIPNALLSVSYEYFPALCNCLKLIHNSNCAGLINAVIDILTELHRLHPSFLLTAERFKDKIYPFLKKIPRAKPLVDALILNE